MTYLSIFFIITADIVVWHVPNNQHWLLLLFSIVGVGQRSTRPCVVLRQIKKAHKYSTNIFIWQEKKQAR